MALFCLYGFLRLPLLPSFIGNDIEVPIGIDRYNNLTGWRNCDSQFPWHFPENPVTFF